MTLKEHSIISHLRHDARTSLASISHSIQMPISTVYDKITKMHHSNVITRFTALVDFSKLGYHYHAKLALKVNRTQRKDIFQFLQEHDSINSLYEINGGFDFLIETIHPSIKEYIEFLDAIKEQFDLEQIQEYQVISTVQQEKFLQNTKS